MCLYNQPRRNKKYLPNEKNGGVIPAVKDTRTLHIETKCRQCIECRKQKQREWQMRIAEDIKVNTNGKFVTLTISDEELAKLATTIPRLQGYTLDNAIAKKAMRYFLERWRYYTGKSLRHWGVTELGHKGTENVHIHAIVWTDEKFNLIRKAWKYGHIWPSRDIEGLNYVNEQTATYITGYISKIDKQHSQYIPWMTTSAGIGKDYINSWNAQKHRYQGYDTNQMYKTSSGHEIPMPAYWRNKIYTEEQKEKLWIIQMNKNERWVCGEKTNGEKDYINTKDYYREESAKMGYGTGEIDPMKKEYEENIRIEKTKMRIERARIRASKEHREIKREIEYKEIKIRRNTIRKN